MRTLITILLGYLFSLSCFSQATVAKKPVSRNSTKPTTTKPAIAKIQLALTTSDDIDILSGPLPTNNKTGTLLKNIIVKVSAHSTDKKMILIDSEMGKGWIAADTVDFSFDKNVAIERYSTEKEMTWFFDRFNDSTGYETMSFETETFSAEEYRSLLHASIHGNDDYDGYRNDRRGAQMALARSLFSRLKAGSKDPEDQYFAQKYYDKSYWMNAKSSYTEFWASMPTKFNSDKSLLMRLIPNGAHTSYKSFSDEIRDDFEIARLTFPQNPEAFEFSSNRIKDDKDLTLMAALVNPQIVVHASQRLRDDQEIFLKIAPINAFSIMHASERIKNDSALVLSICKHSPWALQYASAEVRSNPAVFSEISKQNPMVISLASESLKASVPLLKTMYTNAPQFYKKTFYDSLPDQFRHQVAQPKQ